MKVFLSWSGERSRAVAEALRRRVGTAVSLRWRNRRTRLQKAQWARLEKQGWTLALVGRDRGGDVLVSALHGYDERAHQWDDRASLRIRKDGTVYGTRGEWAIVYVPSPRVTRQPSIEMLGEEHEHLHRLARLPHTICFGQTRKVNWQSTISVGGAIYSVPHELVDERVWVRIDGSELIVVHIDGPAGPSEVARHELTTPGRPALCDEHYPPKPAGALDRKPRARSLEERAFLALGQGAERWLIAAAAAGAQRVRRKTAEAIDLAKLHGPDQVEQALASCANAGRFADGDLQAILAHQQRQAVVVPLPLGASEASSLQRSTRSWEGFGR